MRWPRRRRIARLGALGLLTALAGLGVTLAMPVSVWRTGRQAVRPLPLTTGVERPAPPRRLWIDTDAACGHTPRTDVDDCLALWLLATRPGRDEVVGISTVFGNAPLEVTDRVTRELVGRLAWQGRRAPPPVARGRSRPLGDEQGGATPAEAALIRALRARPATIVALGPLTNVAQALAPRPELRRNVERVVAVMGRRPGHLFHPSEGSGRGTLLGHGPVFRDFNFTADREAARALAAMRLPVTLVPYDAARGIEISSRHLDGLAARGEAEAWIARRSRGWLDFWQTDVGRSGFYPFDLMAAVGLVAPSLLRCAEAEAWVGKDPRLFLPLLRREGLLVEGRGTGAAASPVRYCPATVPGAAAEVRRWFLEAPAPPVTAAR